MRKSFSFLLFIIFTSISNVVYADFYGNLSLGLNNVQIQKNLTYPLEGDILTQSYFKTAYQGFHGQVGLGYIYQISSQWQLALEANADWYNGRTNYHIDNWFLTIPAGASETLYDSWSLFFLPGYRLNDKVQLFFGPGISTGLFKVSSHSAPTGGNIGLSGSGSQWLTGWSIKTGTSLALTNALDLLLIYQYTYFDSMTRTRVEPLSTSTLQASYRPQVGSVMVGLKYLFNGTMVVANK